MKKSRVLWSVVLFWFLGVHLTYAFDSLNENIIIESAIKHYPKIYVNEQKVRAAESQFLEATGAFDTKLDIKQRQFVGGYYEDTGYLESKLVKPLPLVNSRVYTGYLRSQNGNYPELNQYYNTKSDGRAIFGFEFSLLRGFLINEQNAIRDISSLDVKIEKYNNTLMQSQIKADARKAYWKYFYTKKIFNLYEDVLNVAIKRQSALEVQVKNGDKPQIVLEENRRTILRRQSLLENIRRELLNSALNLSMYFRNEEGDMYDFRFILEKDLPAGEFEYIFPNNPTIDLSNILVNRFDVKISEILLKQGNIKLKLAKNDILPVVDIAFETSKDFGQGPVQKNPTAQKIALNVSIPIENNKQTGKYNKEKSYLKIVQNELKLLKDSIANEVKMTFNRINEVYTVISNSDEEIKVAEKLLEAENTRFKNGDSDFFMINAREQDLLFVREYNIRNRLALAETLIEYNFMTKDSLGY